MISRKEKKKLARQSLKRHYLLFVLICLLASVMGIEYTTSTRILTLTVDKAKQRISTNSDGEIKFLRADEDTLTGERQNVTEPIEEEPIGSGIVIAAGTRSLYEILLDDYEKWQDRYNSVFENEETGDPAEKITEGKGVFAAIVNAVSSGSFVKDIILGLHSMTNSRSVTYAMFMIGSMLVTFLFWFLIKDTYHVVLRRMILEGRMYTAVTPQRFLFLVQVRKLPKVAWAMFVKEIYRTLWMLTIIGLPIKYYAYLMVPFILAENPGLSGNEAITLSRRMMNGHKWEYFLNDLTFLGWMILNALTLGLSGMLYSNAYRAAYFGECYCDLREQAIRKGIAGEEVFHDPYLFAYAPEEKLQEAYRLTYELSQEDLSIPDEMKHGMRAFILRWFGVSFYSRELNERYAKIQAKEVRLKRYQLALEQKAYPMSLNPIPEKERNPRMAQINYTRLYSVTSIILLFFIFSILGWGWEVAHHLVTEGWFSNRGALHGPWLPIYGSGGVVMLILLYRLRAYPPAVFSFAVVISGVMEYATAWGLAVLYDGKNGGIIPDII